MELAIGYGCSEMMKKTTKILVLSGMILLLGALEKPAQAAEEKTAEYRAQQLVINAYKQIIRGEFSSAVPILQKALQLNSKNTEAHRYLAFSFLRSGLVSHALEETQKTLDLGADLPQDHFAMAEAQFYLGRPEQAIKFYINALKIDPLFAQARIGVIRSLIAMGKVDEARQICLKAAYNSPNYSSGLQFKKLLNEMQSRTPAGGPAVSGS